MFIFEPFGRNLVAVCCFVRMPLLVDAREVRGCRCPTRATAAYKDGCVACGLIIIVNDFKCPVWIHGAGAAKQRLSRFWCALEREHTVLERLGRDNA